MCSHIHPLRIVRMEGSLAFNEKPKQKNFVKFIHTVMHFPWLTLRRRQDYAVHLKQYGGKLVDARYFTAAIKLMQQRHLYPAFIVLSDDPDWTR
jgi:hypothetical protein